jgi:hypothetical protein
MLYPVKRVVLRLCTSLFIWYLIIAHIYFAASNVPLLVSISRQSPGVINPFYHSAFPFDYNVYLSVITLGKNGYWLNRDAFTSENTKPGIFYFYYIIVGKAAAVFNLWPPVAYHLARIFSVELFIIAVYFVCRVFLEKNLAFWASLFSTILTVSPFVFFLRPGIFSQFIPFWYDLEALQRLDGLPHHIFGQAFLLFALAFFFLYLSKPRIKLLFFTCISVLLGGLVLPPAMLPVIIGLPLSYAIYLLFNFIKRKKIYIKGSELVGFFVICASALVPLSLSFYQTKLGYPWSIWITWEIVKWNFHEPLFDFEFLLSFILLFILSFPAILHNLQKSSLKQIYSVVWALLPFALLPFVNILGIGKIRLLNTAVFIPYGILITVFIFKIIKNIKIRVILIAICILISLPVTVYLWLIQIRSAYTSTLYANIFISKPVWQAIDYLKATAPKDSVFISYDSAGNIIPAYVPIKSYFGHINQTMDYSDKQGNVWLFYTGRMKDNEASDFLKMNKIAYVYYGPDEKSLGGTPYSFLKPIYQTVDITIFAPRLSTD